MASAPGVAACGMAATMSASTAGACLESAWNVTSFGATGDGVTPCADAFQAAIDAAEAAGGGVVFLPSGTYVLEKTPLVASRVHLRGAGAATILRGSRPDGAEGAALISNKGQQAPRYDGAHDWSISHLAIDSPATNGIVITHAARVYVGFIYGIDVYNHFIDTVGKDLLCENLFLTGHSGTSTFQIDSIHGAQTIWDGEQAVAPLRDGTDTEDLILRNSIITATAGSQGARPQHDVSVHFHGSEARGFIFSDLILGGATTGFYQDADTAYHDIQINNVRSLNPGRAIWFNPGRTGQRNLMIRGLQHAPESSAGGRSIEIHGRDGVILSDSQIEMPDACDIAVDFVACERISVNGLQARGTGGTGLRLPRDGGDAYACQFDGFDSPGL